MGKLDNKIVIMTGVSSGTGRASAKLFCQEGAKVVGLARRVNLLDELAEELSSEGYTFTPMACDLVDSAQVKSCVDKTIEMYGRVDVLCNFAGATDYLRVVHTSDDDVYTRTMDINLRGPFNTCREVIPHMMAQKGGVIVNCSSMGGVKGYGGGAVYCMAKHGLVGLGRAIAATYAYDGIRCNTVCPGSINTAMGNSLMDPSRPENVDENGRLLAQDWIDRCSPYNMCAEFMQYGINFNSEPEDQAKVFLFLASDDSRFITGEEIISAGGIVQR